MDEHFRTNLDHVYAVGDVVGFPALASTSMEQGRLAAYHAFGETTASARRTMPIGIYTIPEVSYVGEYRGAVDRGVCALRGRRFPLPRTGPRPDLR